MPRKPQKFPTYRDAVFARDMIEAREDRRDLQRKSKRWRLDVEKMQRDLLKKKKELDRVDPRKIS